MHYDRAVRPVPALAWRWDDDGGEHRRGGGDGLRRVSGVADGRLGAGRLLPVGGGGAGRGAGPLAHFGGDARAAGAARGRAGPGGGVGGVDGGAASGERRVHPPGGVRRPAGGGDRFDVLGAEVGVGGVGVGRRGGGGGQGGPRGRGGGAGSRHWGGWGAGGRGGGGGGGAGAGAGCDRSGVAAHDRPRRGFGRVARPAAAQPCGGLRGGAPRWAVCGGGVAADLPLGARAGVVLPRRARG